MTGRAVMGAVFALTTANTDLPVAGAVAVASGMQITFAVAALLMLAALATASGSRRVATLTLN